MAIVCASTRETWACGTCRGAGDTGGALTASDERWSVSLGTLLRDEIGSWDSSGRAHGEPSNVSAWDLASTLAVGVRVIRPVEVAAMFGGGVGWLRAPGLDTLAAGATDLTVRSRVDFLAEDPMRPWRPMAGAWFAVRAPVGSSVQPSAGGTSAIVGSFGLGAWEFALGADLRRTFGRRWQPFVSIEGALRAPDTAPGFDRALGPRAGFRTGVTYFASSVFAISSLGEFAIEGDITLRGQQIANSWQQRTALGVAAMARLPVGLRLALAVWTDLPADGLGRNANATVRIAFTIGYAGAEASWRACPMESPATNAPIARADFTRPGG